MGKLRKQEKDPAPTRQILFLLSDSFFTQPHNRLIFRPYRLSHSQVFFPFSP